MLVIMQTTKRKRITATGVLLAGAAAIAGAGSIFFGAGGSLQSGASSISGAGTVKSTGTGALLAGAASIAGAGDGGGLVTGSGALASGNSAVAGAGTSKSTGTGALADQASAVAGSGTVSSPVTWTSWSTVDKAASVTLSNSNLTATSASSGDRGVRAVDPQIAGKFYVEYTAGTTSGGDQGAGICGPGALFVTAATNVYGTSAIGGAAENGSLAFTSAGAIYFDGSTSNSVGTAIGTGDVLCMAVDLDNDKIWFRRNGGNWNNSGTDNPATNSGGISIASIKKMGVFPCCCFGISGTGWTANFGASSFAQTVPSGFTAGWSAGSMPLYVDPASVTSNEASTGTTCAVTVTTQGASDVLIFVITEKNTTSPSVSSVVGASLGSFTRRKQFNFKPSTIDNYIEVWRKHSAAALTGEVITVTTSATMDDTTVVAIAVVGADQSTFWDANGSLPATASGTSSVGTVTGVSTTTTHDLILAFLGAANAGQSVTEGTGYSYLRGHRNHGGTNFAVAALEGAIVASAQSGISVPFSVSSTEWGMVVDAVKQA